MKPLHALAALLPLWAAGSAHAQSVLVPSGDSAVTQPGGTEGRYARRNILEAIRNGDSVGGHHLPHAAEPVEPRPHRRPRPNAGQ